jgi:NitT/TauT family transport system permease protein
MSGTAVRAGPSTGPVRRLLERVLPPLVTGIVLLGAWQLTVTSGMLSVKLVSDPSQVASQLWQTLHGVRLFGVTIWADLATTLHAVAVGYAIGAVAGIVLGYALGRVPFLADVFRPYVQAVAALPKIALVPLLIFIFGIGVTAETVMVAIMVFIIVFFSTFSGVMSVREAFVDAARIMGARRLTVARRIVMPATLPSVFSGLRAGVSFAFIGAITTEFIAATSGLGWMMQQATAVYDPVGLFTGLVYVIVVVWALGQVVGLAQSRLLRWQRR